MWGVRLLLAVSLLCSTHAYYFESGFAHHYTYWAETSLFGQGNVTTVLKVLLTASRFSTTLLNFTRAITSKANLIQVKAGRVRLPSTVVKRPRLDQPHTHPNSFFVHLSISFALMCRSDHTLALKVFKSVLSQTYACSFVPFHPAYSFTHILHFFSSLNLQFQITALNDPAE